MVLLALVAAVVFTTRGTAVKDRQDSAPLPQPELLAVADGPTADPFTTLQSRRIDG
ncbi:hypothetical protein [Actinacidiphila glaucinigra]